MENPTNTTEIGWNYGTSIDGNVRKTKCNFCNKKINGGGVTRLKEHLAGVGGNVMACTNVPQDVKKLVRAHIVGKKNDRNKGKLEKQRIQEELMNKPQQHDSDSEDDENEDDRNVRRAMQESRDIFREQEMQRSYRQSGVGFSQTERNVRGKSVRMEGDFETRTAARIDSYMQKKGGSSQPSIKSAIKGIKNAKKHIGRAIAKFFYFNHIPYNAASSPYYATMVDAIAECGRGIDPPTTYELSHPYLKMELDEVGSYISTFHNFWDEYGCTLMCDGWSTQNRRKIINFLVYSTHGTIFLKFVDATDEFQSGEYICRLMDEVVETIGENRVVQIVTDNGANYKAAGQLLMEKRKYLYWTPCAAHYIDLILEDISKEEEVKTVISNCQLITTFIYNHGWLLSIMRKETNGKELIRPTVTRFATHFIALVSIHKHKNDLRRMIATREWASKMPRLTSKDKRTATNVADLIYNETFWTTAASIILVFEPLVKVLRMVDSDDKADMGYLYEAMDLAKESIRKNVGVSQSEKWWNIIDKRWERQLHRPIHAAGYFLNPIIQYGNAVNDNEVINGFNSVVKRMVPDTWTQIKIGQQVDIYRMKVGEFGSSKARDAISVCSPAQWWSIIGRADAPHLTRLAMHILSQTVSSSNCERNWTTFSMIHTKLRNRIKMENLEKVVYVHYNMRLRAKNVKRRDTDDQLIDLNHIFHEEDPLAEWTTEIEPRLLDDDPAMVDMMHNAVAAVDGIPARTTTSQSTGNGSGSSNDDAGGYNIGLASNYGVGSSAAGGSQRPTIPYVRRGVVRTRERRDSNLNVQYEEPQNYDYANNPYTSKDPPNYRHSTSDYTGGYFYHGANETYSSDISSDQNSQTAYTTQNNEPFSFDNMLATFIGTGQMQYDYPSHHATEIDEEDYENIPYIAPRNSYWM